MNELPPNSSAAVPSNRSALFVRGLGILLPLAALAALGVLVSAVWQSYRHEAERNQAMQLLKRQGFGWAADALKRAAERNGRDVEVIRELALASVKHYFLPDAEKYLTQWCDLEPAAAEPHWHRLRFWKQFGRLDDALADAEKLVAIAPMTWKSKKK